MNNTITNKDRLDLLNDLAEGLDDCEPRLPADDPLRVDLANLMIKYQRLHFGETE
jgi:hypothetical protein